MTTFVIIKIFELIQIFLRIIKKIDIFRNMIWYLKRCEVEYCTNWFVHKYIVLPTLDVMILTFICFPTNLWSQNYYIKSRKANIFMHQSFGAIFYLTSFQLSIHIPKGFLSLIILKMFVLTQIFYINKPCHNILFCNQIKNSQYNLW
jgi:hypothetical protein